MAGSTLPKILPTCDSFRHCRFYGILRRAFGKLCVHFAAYFLGDSSRICSSFGSRRLVDLCPSEAAGRPEEADRELAEASCRR